MNKQRVRLYFIDIILSAIFFFLIRKINFNTIVNELHSIFNTEYMARKRHMSIAQKSIHVKELCGLLLELDQLFLFRYNGSQCIHKKSMTFCVLYMIVSLTKDVSDNIFFCSSAFHFNFIFVAFSIAHALAYSLRKSITSPS